VAQSGLWEVDGNGLSKIEDPKLARAFVEKVNAMNADTALKTIVPSFIFASLSQSSSAPLVLWCLGFAILYGMRDILTNATK